MAKQQTNQKTEDLESAVYDKLLEKLNLEKDRIEKELKGEYENARKYVKSNPEEGVAYAFAGGLLLGIVVAKILSK
ncbi:MAG: hypothetical protein WEB89_00145 [Balneolales bacterium]